MGVIRKKNPATGEWEVYGSTEAKDINLIDVGDNFSEKTVVDNKTPKRQRRNFLFIKSSFRFYSHYGEKMLEDLSY